MFAGPIASGQFAFWYEFSVLKAGHESDPIVHFRIWFVQFVCVGGYRAILNDLHLNNLMSYKAMVIKTWSKVENNNNNDNIFSEILYVGFERMECVQILPLTCKDTEVVSERFSIRAQ